jgi:hypothetical protein
MPRFAHPGYIQEDKSHETIAAPRVPVIKEVSP